MRFVLIPGLNNNFNSDFFKEVIQYAKEKNIDLVLHTFSPEIMKYTINKQLDEIKQYLNDSTIFIAKSLGCVPTILLGQKCVLFNPVISVNQSDKNHNYDIPFKEMEKKPILISIKKLNELPSRSVILFNIEDPKIDKKSLLSINSSNNLLIRKINSNMHDLDPKGKKILIGTLNEITKK